jgi:hypothetical protein
VTAGLQIDDRLVNLAPGMAVTVEIKTGSRRIIDYLSALTAAALQPGELAGTVNRTAMAFGSNERQARFPRAAAARSGLARE